MSSSPLTKIRLTLAYEGSEFYGWQKQAGNTPTVQGHLEQALGKIFNQPIVTVGSGRTDAGVHARNQEVHFEAPENVAEVPLKSALNSMTPESILIKNVRWAPSDFHALQSAESKIYHYHVHNSSHPHPFRNRLTTWVRRPLDVESMNQVSEIIKGTHDFKSFQTAGTPVKSTVRKVTHAQWERMGKNHLCFKIEGNGFLKQMVRNIVGTVFHLVQHDQGPEKMLEILNSYDRQKAKGTAPPQGLYLYKVKYPRKLDIRCRQF